MLCTIVGCERSSGHLSHDQSPPSDTGKMHIIIFYSVICTHYSSYYLPSFFHQASPFVATILRPLKEFDTSFSSRTPPQIGDDWKYSVIGTVSEKYSLAVEELIATVKRTEEALKSRKTRRMMAGGMSDGEKVKLQLFLDHKEFKSHVEELGVDSDRISGLVKLRDLTQEAESLLEPKS